MSSNAIAFKPTILTGQANFTRWHRELIIAAKGIGVWDILSGDVEMPKPPSRPTRHDVTESASYRMLEMLSVEYKLELLEYQIDKEEYERVCSRFRLAFELLVSSVDRNIIQLVGLRDSPKEVMDLIVASYMMPESPALDIAHRRLASLSLKQCVDMTEYLNKAELLRLDIIDLQHGNTYPNKLFIQQVLGGLSSEYKSLLDLWSWSLNDPNTDCAGFKTLSSQLLFHEIMLKDKPRDF